MAKEFAKRFYNSKAWKECRDLYKQSVNGLCEECLDEGKYTLGDEVHHKIELTPYNINNPDVTLNWNNLQLLCFNHHQDITHNRTAPVRKGFSFNEKGELIYTPPIK